MIIYKTNEPIEIEKLSALYESVGWVGYTNHPEIMANILSGAQFYMSAWDGEDLVGLVRTIGDGCYILYIQDILIRPEYQRQGIGQTLIKQALEKGKGMHQIILTTDNTEKTSAFYRSVGFVSMEETGAITFIYRGDKE